MEIKKSRECTEISVPITRYYLYIFVMGCGSAFMLLSAIMCVMTTIQTGIFHKEQCIVSIALFVFFLMYFLWFTMGKEKLVISGNNITVSKTNGIVSFSRRYKISDIKSIHAIAGKYDSDNFTDRKRQYILEGKKAFPFWIAMGKIKLEFSKKTLSILNGLKGTEADKVIGIIKLAMEERMA